MRRTITIASSLAILCLAVLVIWLYANRAKQEGTPVPEEAIRKDQASKPVSDPPTENNADVRVFQLPVNIAFFSDQITLTKDDKFSPCYFDREKKLLYRWNGVVLQNDQLPRVYMGTISSVVSVLNAKDFTVVPIEAPVKYREDDGDYRPGYLDSTFRVFYEWKGIVLNKEELLDKSRDGQNAIPAPIRSGHTLDSPFGEVIQIPIPAHMKDQPQLWKKGGAYTSEASIRAEKKAIEKKAVEKRALEKRAREPRVFQLFVGIAFFGENDFSPCYYDAQNRTLYRWKGVVLRWDQMPEVYKKQKAIVLSPTGFLVVSVEAPVNYREVNGEYRPGYLDRSIKVFYEWKGAVLSKQEVLDKSQDGQDAVVKPTAFSQVIEIPMPAHLKDQPGLWKKT